MEARHGSDLLFFFVLDQADEAFIPIIVLCCVCHLPVQFFFRNVSDGQRVQYSLRRRLTLSHILQA